jgi:hypothetical protein
MFGPCRIKGESVGLPVYPPIVARQQLNKDVPAARVVGGGVFCAVSEKSRRLVLPRTSCYVNVMVSERNRNAQELLRYAHIS